MEAAAARQVGIDRRADRIAEIVAAWHGDFDVTLHNGTVLRLTRNYRDRVLNRPERRPCAAPALVRPRIDQ